MICHLATDAKQRRSWDERRRTAFRRASDAGQTRTEAGRGPETVPGCVRACIRGRAGNRLTLRIGARVVSWPLHCATNAVEARQRPGAARFTSRPLMFLEQEKKTFFS